MSHDLRPGSRCMLSSAGRAAIYPYSRQRVGTIIGEHSEDWWMVQWNVRRQSRPEPVRKVHVESVTPVVTVECGEG